LQDIVDQLAHAIREAAARRMPLRIRGGGTKDFYGGPLQGGLLETRAYCGIVDYDPTELVLVARAGTRLTEVDTLLDQNGQMLSFEPPHFGDAATLGGCIASGLSGPRRPYVGAVRDLVLGVRMLDGNGTDLRFGGQVMKNVAGYDVSRLMAGALGTLGMLLEISIKTLPLPRTALTLRREHDAAQAIELMNASAAKPLPITATCHLDNQLYLRLEGAEPAVRAAREKLGGEEIADGGEFWARVREQRLEFFESAPVLWRLSLKSTTAALPLAGRQLIEWNGAQRWLAVDADAAQVRAAAAQAGGHATLFRGGDKRVGVFQPLAPALFRIHRRLKESFDPHGILNVGRLYPDF
jgi:glycolate dehydrogenase FAD-binding subunit